MTDIETARIDNAPYRPKSTLILAFACLLAATMWTTVTLPEWSVWTTPLLVIVPGCLTVVVMRSSIISAAYLVQVSVYFGIATLILGSDWHPRLVSAVLAWSLAIAVGTLMGGRPPQRTLPVSKPRPVPRWPHYALCGGLIGVDAFLTLSSRSGYAAQLVNGISTPTGILGTLSAAAPIVTLALLLNSIGSDRRSRGVMVLTGAQLIILALSGFRGAGVVFIISILVGAALTLPRGSAWRRSSRLIIALPVLMIAIILTFTIGSVVKNSAAKEARVSSSGTQFFTLDNALKNTSTRLQLDSSLETAIKYRDSAAAKEAVSWEKQLGAVAPRFLWPDKPIVDYGQRVSVAMYGMAYGQSSSTVTTIGDSLLNFGSVGLALIGLFVGFSLSQIEARMHRGLGNLSIVLVAVFVYSAIGQEEPIILIIIGILRNGLVAGGLWVAATLTYSLVRHVPMLVDAKTGIEDSRPYGQEDEGA